MRIFLLSIFSLFILTCDSSPTESATIHGCLDSTACNYNPEANIDNNSCEYADEGYDCDDNCDPLGFMTGLCDDDDGFSLDDASNYLLGYWSVESVYIQNTMTDYDTTMYFGNWETPELYLGESDNETQITVFQYTAEGEYSIYDFYCNEYEPNCTSIICGSVNGNYFLEENAVSIEVTHNQFDADEGEEINKYSIIDISENLLEIHWYNSEYCDGIECYNVAIINFEKIQIPFVCN